jgi:hypothetical protein
MRRLRMKRLGIKNPVKKKDKESSPDPEKLGVFQIVEILIEDLNGMRQKTYQRYCPTEEASDELLAPHMEYLNDKITEIENSTTEVKSILSGVPPEVELKKKQI